MKEVRYMQEWEERIIAKLQKHFSLKPSEAEAYFDNFAPRA